MTPICPDGRLAQVASSKQLQVRELKERNP